MRGGQERLAAALDAREPVPNWKSEEVAGDRNDGEGMLHRPPKEGIATKSFLFVPAQECRKDGWVWK